MGKINESSHQSYMPSSYNSFNHHLKSNFSGRPRRKTMRPRRQNDRRGPGRRTPQLPPTLQQREDRQIVSRHQIPRTDTVRKFPRKNYDIRVKVERTSQVNVCALLRICR